MKHSNNHNYIKDKKNYIIDRENAVENSLRITYENKVQNEEKYGKQIHYNKINEGKEDRLAGKPPKTFEDESMQKAYSHGYYENGSIAIEGEFAKGTFSEKHQLEFGITDFVNGIPIKYLKNLIKYPAYTYGRNYQMGKKAYDYTTKENMTFDEYVFTMELIFPEVKSEAFKSGYYAKKAEENNKEEKGKHR